QVQRIDETGESHTLMILQGYVDSQGDAWQWTRDTLERAIRDQLAGGLSEQENQYTALAELQAFAGTLGRRLGEMHLLLADPQGGEGFGFAIATQADCVQWGDHISEQLQAALNAIDQHRGQLDAVAAEQAQRLLARRGELSEAVKALAQRCTGGVRIRVHGDLHLGQVLVVQGDACFIDFEGEPTRSLTQRRERQSPMKDVTGMLRSFDYAGAMALRSIHGTDQSEQAQQARQHICAAYREQAAHAFLTSYLEVASDLPHTWAEQGTRAALALFSIEKAAYEVDYEARYRPDWLDVPLGGLIGLCKSLMENGPDEQPDEH